MTRFSLEALPHREALAYFRSKGYAPANRRFDYRDVWREEHARSWVVAKAVRDDVSEVIRAAVDRQLAQGVPIAQAIRDLTPELQRLGWWGMQRMRDPKTGQERLVRLGSERRLRVIFDTNMRTSHAAGHWAAIQRTKKAFPYLHYIQIDRPTKRHDHTRFHDQIWQVDDPIWLRIYPPNGWFCGCHVIQRTEGWMKRNKREVSPPLDLDEIPWRNKRTGKVEQVPRGIDPAFNANPGAAWLEMQKGAEEAMSDLSSNERARDLGILQGLRIRQLGTGRETLVVVDPRGEQAAMRTAPPETPAKVPLRGLDIAPGSALLHSHPSEASLSLADIDTLLLSGAASITAVGPGGSIWRARPRPVAAAPLNMTWLRFQERQYALADELEALHRLDRAFIVAHARTIFIEKTGLIRYTYHTPGRAGALLRRYRALIERLVEDVSD